MEAPFIKAIETLLNTDNYDWNEHAKEMLVEVIKTNSFESPNKALEVTKTLIDLVITKKESDVSIVYKSEELFEENNLNGNQRLFITTSVINYLKWYESEFIEDSFELTYLRGKEERLKADYRPLLTSSSITSVGNLREFLKQWIGDELKQLPDSIDKLDTNQRLNLVFKLIPYILPKVKTIHSEKGESELFSTSNLMDFKW